MRTLSVSPIRTDGPDDVDNVVVDGIEALRQRIQQRLRFPLGTWDLGYTPRHGVDLGAQHDACAGRIRPDGRHPGRGWRRDNGCSRSDRRLGSRYPRAHLHRDDPH